MALQQKLTQPMRLLKKGRRGLLRMIFSRTGMITVLLLCNTALLLAMFLWLDEFLPQIYGGSVLMTAVVVIHLFNSSKDPSAKLTWLLVILVLPVVGNFVYLFSLRDLSRRVMRKRWQQIDSRSRQWQGPSQAEALEAVDAGAAGMARYARGCGGFPVYANTAVTYFPQGEDKLEAMLLQLEQAREFIFLEYFIVEEGHMWGSVLEVLARKAAQGVQVRLLYDGTCEFALLPKDYPKKLKALGIECRVFAPVTPFVSTCYNYRDHRKILVIDGRVAFTGGVNLADEYINRVSPFGHWKDTAVMLRGPAVRGFTVLFLQMWGLTGKQTEVEPYLKPVEPEPVAGFVMPYGESPMDDDLLGRQVYMDILNRARRYVHIMTPYLILDAQMEQALCYAAQRGVEVVLILPGIPDKRLPYALAKTHYKTLMQAGVRIREYTPGFVHAKVFVSDDREAVVGTINLDYRSLYHHFECAAYLYGVDCLRQIEEDMQRTLAQCRPVDEKLLKGRPWWMKLAGAMMKALAPLL